MRLNCICRICGKHYQYVYENSVSIGNHSKNVCNSCRANHRRFALKDKMIAYKGGHCSICGYKKCNRALTFHHLDPNQKDFNFAGNHSRKWEKIQIELDKCILVCQNCHCEIHAGVTDIVSRKDPK